MELLTPLQKQLLKSIGVSPIRDQFYLTGGTALSAFYLHHRYSEVLDFFTADPLAVTRVAPVLQDIAQGLNAQVSFTRSLGSFLECFFEGDSGERFKMDFAQDSPYRLQPTKLDTEYDVYVDNVTDIACNKLSALFDRAEPKDFVDVFFVCQELMPFTELEELVHQKHVGIDDYWLAVAIQRVSQVGILPRMIKPLDLDELKAFFLSLAREIMGRIDQDIT
ncbi:MAG: nucleotidyl transferase AbiEii/AbiGii toxin family protein [Anaerolineales bacterium]